MNSDLKGMLAGMEPVMHDGCDGVLPVSLTEVVGLVREPAGLTLNMTAEMAEVAGLRVLRRAAWNTLGVQSDLAGLELGAAIAALRNLQVRYV